MIFSSAFLVPVNIPGTVRVAHLITVTGTRYCKAQGEQFSPRDTRYQLIFTVHSTVYLSKLYTACGSMYGTYEYILIQYPYDTVQYTVY